jgi:hypothetical protein
MCVLKYQVAVVAACNRSNEIQAKTKPWSVPAVIETFKAPNDASTIMFRHA